MRTIKNLDGLVGKTVRITERVNLNDPDVTYTVKGDYKERTREVRITSVEDKGDFYYIGYRSPSLNVSTFFGYFTFLKNEDKKFGVVAVEEL